MLVFNLSKQLFALLLILLLAAGVGCQSKAPSESAPAEGQAQKTESGAPAEADKTDNAHASSAGGKTAPSFNLPYMEACMKEKGSLDLSAYLGKKAILLDWWSINCTSCIQEVPKIIDIHDRYKDDLLVVGVNVDSFVPKKRVERFLKSQKFTINYTVVVDSGLEILKKYDSTILPTTVVIDKKGNIIFHHVGYKAGDEATIEESVKAAISL